MILPVPRRRYDERVPELMDREDQDAGLVQDALRNLRSINRWYGGLSAVRTSFSLLLKSFPSRDQVSILDLGTGSGDQPRALAQFARRHDLHFTIVAVDKNPLMIESAKALSNDYPEIHFEQQDILNLPYSNHTFDVVLCSSVLHHFSRTQAVALVGSMNRIGRKGLIVHDLNRSWIGAGAAWLYTHGTSSNPIVLHDSTMSVLRAFTVPELESIAREAGLANWWIRRYPLFRMVLTAIQKP